MCENSSTDLSTEGPQPSTVERATVGTPQSLAAHRSGEEYLLRRHLFRRLSNGETVDKKSLHFSHPNRWHYDVLRALDYFDQPLSSPERHPIPG